MFKKPKLLTEFLAICRSTGYFEAKATENQLKNIKFLSLAQILRKKVENEWKFKGKDADKNLKIYSENDFTDEERCGTISDNYSAIRKATKSKKIIPFGISEVVNICDKAKYLHGRENEVQIELDCSESLLKLSYFVNDKEKREYFYRVQRERKIWWMKV